MIRTWKSLLGTFAVCALLAGESGAQEIGIDQVGVARLRTNGLSETRPADALYSAEDRVWLDDFQPPLGVGVDPVTIPSDNSVGYAVTSSVDDILYRISRTNRHFYGLDDGFTSAHAFIPLRVMNGGQSLLAINPRAFVNDDGDGGVNMGVTARRYFPSSDRLLAASLWVDYDEGHYGGYTQLGLYGAIIGRYFTTSAFANVPVGEKEEVIARSLNSSFVGNALALTQTSLVESPYAQYQVELAAPIPFFSRFGFEYGLGGYALASAADGIEDGFGVSNRIEAQVTEDLTVNTLVTSDGVFGSNLSVNLELTLPNGMPSRVLSRVSVKSQMTRSDLRSYRVLTNVTRHIRHFAAIDPKDGQIITVAHIDPDTFGGGTGVNDPFGSVAQFEGLPDALQSTFDLIFVRRREDGTDTNLNTGITLFDEQQLLGDGIDHIIDTTLGPVFLPDITPGAAPLLTNSGAPGMDVVTLADWNTVSGFTIDASAGTGDGMDMDAAIAINGRGLQAGEAGDPGVNGFIIDRNTIQNGMYGLVVDSETSGVSTGVVTNNDFLGNALGAIDLNYSGTVVAGLNIDDNLIVAGAAGIGFLPEMAPVIRTNMGFTTNVLAANDDGSTATTVPLGFGIDFFGLAATDVWVNNNGNITFTAPLFTFTPFDLLSTATPIIAPFFGDVDTRNHGLEVTYGQDMVQGQAAFGVNWLDVDYFASNVAHGTQLNDFQLVLIDRSDLGAGDFDIEFNYEQILWETGDASGGVGGVGGNSARVGYANGTTTAFELAGSAVNGAFLDGGPMALISNMLNSSLPGRYRFAVRNGVVTTTGTGMGTGVSVTASDSAVVGTPMMPATFNRNEIQGYDDGLVLRGPGMAMMSFDISDNFINGVGSNGITLITEDMETMTVTGDRNVVINSGGRGLSMVSSGTSTMVVDFRNSVFNMNALGGIKGTAIEGSALSFSFSSPFDPLATEDRNGNGMLDPLEDLNGNGMIDPLVAQASDNDGPGIDIASFDTATLDIDLDEVLIDPNMDAGVTIFTHGFSVADVDITNSVIIDTVDGPDVDLFGEGVVFRSTDDSFLTATITDSLIDGNEGAGVRAQSDINSILDLTIDPTTITNNGGDGITLNREALSTLIVDLDDLFVDTNGGFGLNVLANGGDGGGDDVIITSDNNVFSNNVAGGINYTLTSSVNVFTTHTLDEVDMNGDMMAMTGDGITVTTNNDSFFGSPALTPSVFDSVIVTNNVGNGYTFTSNDDSTIITDILSDTLPRSTLIALNGLDGIEVNHNTTLLTSVRIGNAANPFPDVSIIQNAIDAVDLNFTGSGVVDVTIANTLINGARRLGSPVDPGVTVEYLGSDTAQVYIGQDMGPGRDPTTGMRSGVTITDIGMMGDGINVLYDRDNDVFGSMTLFVADSRIGTGAGTIGGDGVEMTVQDDGFTGEFYQNEIRGAVGDGIRLDTEAELLIGRVVVVAGDPGPGGVAPDPPFTAQDGDANGNMIGDFPTAMSPTLLADPFYSPLLPWADLSPAGTDFTATLIVGDPSMGAGFGGNTIVGNGESGLEISVGANTTVDAIVRDNDLFGNTDGDFTTSTTTNTVATLNTSTNNAEGMADLVVLDPVARMNLLFGDSGFFNRGNFTNPSSTGGVWTVGDVFKPAGRPVFAIFDVTLPDETFPPTPNDFLLNGVQEDEEATFTGAGFIVTPQ